MCKMIIVIIRFVFLKLHLWDIHSGKLRWQWKLPIFNRKYIFSSNGPSSIAMLVYHRVSISGHLSKVRHIYRKSWKTCATHHEISIHGLFHRCLSSENGKDLLSLGRKEMTQKDGGRSCAPRKKKLVLSIESWLFNRDPCN